VRVATARSEQLYAVHPGVAMVQKWAAELKQKTERSLEEWMALVKEEGPKEGKKPARMAENEIQLGMNSACWLAERTKGKGGEEDNPEAYLSAAADLR
jgi:hypothetical protein